MPDAPSVRSTLAGLAEVAAIATVGEPGWYVREVVLPLVADAYALLADTEGGATFRDAIVLIVAPDGPGYRAYLSHHRDDPALWGRGRSTTAAVTDWVLTHAGQIGLTLRFEDAQKGTV